MPLDLSRQVVLRWDQAEPQHASLLQEAAVNAVLLPTPSAAFAGACRSAGIETFTEDQVQFLDLKSLPKAVPGKPVVLTEGQWPGVSRGANVEKNADEVASASNQPWVDANGFWVGYLRALEPARPSVLGYVPNLGERLVPFDTLELALIEAWVSGGNYVLSVEPRFRSKLLAGDEKARAAWRDLGRTARWLQKQVPLFRQPTFPIVTLLVEEGETTAEIANLMYRQNTCPALVRADQPPPPDPQHRLALVAVDLKPPAVPVRNRILAHAEAGASVVVNGDWWQNNRLKKIKSQEDRDYYQLGRGQVIAYHDTISDPSEFALDVIDIVTHARRAVRLWNAYTVIALATGKGLMHCVNYGSPIDQEIQARIQGSYSKATLLRPDAPPRELKASQRGTTTEVMIPELRRLGVVVFG
ncbi:MAG TPA: hypothetical protein VG672_05485 [Bryobacteraceae bacterium]|jgi:hypothetical protein|nr:hypothetical protein [Bryobacteraceae bacterium]